MLQKQYYTYKLSKTQIDHILANYNIKYTTMKIEIESKLTNMIQVFLKDIFAFLENIEDIATEREKLKEFDRIKEKLQSTSEKLKKKTKNEIKLQSTIDTLSKESASLKEKINNLSQNSIQFPNTNKNRKERLAYTGIYKTPKKGTITIPRKSDIRSNLSFTYKDSIKEINKFINLQNEERHSVNDNSIGNRIRISKFINDVGIASKKEDTEREEKESEIKTMLKEYDDIIKDEIDALQKEEENIKEMAKLTEEEIIQ